MPWEQDYSLKPNQVASSQVTPKESISIEEPMPWEQDYSSANVFNTEQELQASINSLPELSGILNDEDPRISAAITPALLTATNPEEFGKILNSAFPHIGIIQTPEGEFLAYNQKNQRYASINKPGLSKADVIQGAAAVTEFFPAGKYASGGLNLFGKVAKGAVGAGLTQSANESLQALSGGDVNPEDVALASGFGAAAETIMPALSAAKQAILPSKGIDVSAARESIKGLERATGETVGLTKPQQTMQPDKLLEQRFLSQLTGSAKIASDRLKLQNKEVFNATTKLIDNIGGEEALTVGAKNFRTASQKAIDNAKTIRREKASPLYKEAFDVGADVDILPIKSIITEKLSSFPDGGKIARSIVNAEKLIDGSKNLKQFHGAKLEIDALINGQGESALDNTAKAALRDIQESLLAQMDLASPQYYAAREAFKLASPDVDTVANSVLGKVARINDDNLKQVSRAIFDAQEVNPKVVADAKKLIQEADPAAWDDLLRVELQRRIGAMTDLITDNPDAVANTPAQIKRALFGNPAQRKVLLSSMSAEQRSNFRYLEDVLGRAASGRAQGSPTAGFQAVKDKLKGGAVAIKEFMFSPAKSTSEAGTESMVNRNAATLAEAVFNPMWADDFARIRIMNPNTPATAKAMTQLLREISKSKYQENVETKEKK